jgi:MFS transporter, DHA2 family, methylenomycin A resistance protein
MAYRTPKLTLTAICLGFFMIQLDATIVNVALPAIGRDVGGSIAGLQWVIDSYTLVLAAGMLPAGSAADRIGARRVFEGGLVVFTGGSALCAAAPTLLTLIAARTIQGAGAAAVLPSSLALIVQEFPEAGARARALGIWGGIASVGLAAGPVLGGAAVELSSWRTVFVVNVPVGVVAAVLIRRFVGASDRTRREPRDLWGFVTAAAALGCATAGFIEIGQRGWSDPLSIGLLLTAAGAGAGFVAVERRADAPMVPLKLFRIRRFSAAVGVGLLFNLCLYGALLCLSLYLQRARGQSALDAGLLVLPMLTAVGVGAIASGRLTARRGPRCPMLAGMALALLGSVVLSLVGPSTSLAVLLIGSVALGLCSLAMPAMTSVALGSVDSGRAGLASGVLNAARQSGGALGVALLGSLLAAGGGLHAALPVASAGYLVAIGLSWVATTEGRWR